MDGRGALQSVSCNICGSKSFTPIFSAVDYNHAVCRERFQFVKCSSCGLVFQNPRIPPEKIGGYYPSAYEDYRFGRKGISAADIDALEHFKIRQLRAAVGEGKGRILDVGCGEAGFLLKCKAIGFEPYGCDYSLGGGARNAGRNGVRLKQGDFVKLDYPKKFFKAITFWHVLEHLGNPRKALVKARSLLADDGVLIVAVPNADGLQAKLFGKYWSHVDAPRHYYLFSTRTMMMLLEKSGFGSIEANHLAFHYNAWGYGTSVLNALGLRARGTENPSGLIKSVAMAVFSIPTYFEAAMQRGGTIVVNARKK